MNPERTIYNLSAAQEDSRRGAEARTCGAGRWRTAAAGFWLLS